MTLSLGLLCVCAAAVVAFGVSALCALGVGLLRRRLAACAPAAEARLWFGLALLPAAACVTVMTAALAPLFGWITDHCVTAADPHAAAHPHLCVHHVEAWPALPIVLLAGVLCARVVFAGVRTLWLGAAGQRLAARLERLSAVGERDGELSGARVLQGAAPQAFVLGVTRPRLFVTQALLAPQHRIDLPVVLAHEQAHIRRGDALKRLVARIGLAFHLPGVGAYLEWRFSCAQEMAADEEASEAVGSREDVARALVRLARARAVAAPVLALAFRGSAIEARVRALLAPPRTGALPGPRWLGACALLGAAGIGMSAHGVHHTLEITLGLLSLG